MKTQMSVIVTGTITGLSAAIPTDLNEYLSKNWMVVNVTPMQSSNDLYPPQCLVILEKEEKD